MQLVVLVKPVPRSDALRYDAQRRVVLREASELVVNPFDQRALKVGLELRRPADRLTAIALGPAGAAGLLRETLALGADRALHLCDAAFAGSDVLATSTALASAVRTAGGELVLTGARSTDSDTGLVGPEVAGLLGVPLVSNARSVRRDEAGREFEVVHDTDDGRATSRVDAPAVLTVGEKAGKPLKVSDEALARTPSARVETVGPSAIGISAAEAGAFGSPTAVEAIEEVGPSRKVRLFAEGTAADRVSAAVAALRALLAQEPEPPSLLPWAPAYDPDREVVVLASDGRGAVTSRIGGTVTQLRRRLPGYTIAATVYGARPPEPASRGLAADGVSRGYWLDPGPGRFDTGDVAAALARTFDIPPRPAALVCVASPFGREVAGQLAARWHAGAIGDAVDVAAAPSGRLLWTKPSFGGSTLATISCRSTPAIATMAPESAIVAAPRPDPAPVPWEPRPCVPPSSRVRKLEEVAEPLEGPPPDDAEVVVAVGSGVGGPEEVARLRPTLERWGAALVGTRRVVDAGWIPGRAQLGLTGRRLAPRLAVLLGVRGSANHMIGWRRAEVVLAINRDPAAEVFASADLGIVGSVEEVVPALDAPLASALRALRPR